MNIEAIFPVFIAYDNNFLSEEENLAIIESINDLKKDTISSDNGWLSKNLTPFNNYSSCNLTNVTDFSFLVKRVSDRVNEFAKYQNDVRTHQCSHSWFNIYTGNQYQEPHHHNGGNGSSFSAVYFPVVPEGSSSLYLLNPSTDILSNDVWEFRPQEKSLIIFSSTIRHFVTHGFNKTNRISIAFNFIPCN